jgi:hypothetical protein
MTAFTQRVEIGAYYTDGEELWEVTEVHPLGAVTLRNAHFLGFRSMGIDAFRRAMWLVKDGVASSRDQNRMTREEARIVLLERELDEAVHTIEFLHGCLTGEGFTYAYPEHTAQTIERMRAFVPGRPMCIHSVTTADCDSCVDRNRHFALWAEAEQALGLHREDKS